MIAERAKQTKKIMQLLFFSGQGNWPRSATLGKPSQLWLAAVRVGGWWRPGGSTGEKNAAAGPL